MKNDIEKIKDTTIEMDINDLVYSMMQDEYDDLVDDISIGQYDDDIDSVLDRAYFYKRVLSVLQNEDIPIRSSIGLLDTIKVLLVLAFSSVRMIPEQACQYRPPLLRSTTTISRK